MGNFRSVALADIPTRTRKGKDKSAEAQEFLAAIRATDAVVAEDGYDTAAKAGAAGFRIRKMVAPYLAPGETITSRVWADGPEFRLALVRKVEAAK